MRILLLHQYFLEEDDSGGSRFNEMARVWTEKGHEVTVLAGMMHYSASEKRHEYKGKFAVKKQQGDITVWRSHVSESYNKHFLGRLWAYFSFVFSSLWVGLFRLKEKYDVILVTSPPLFVGISGYVLSRIKRKPFLFEVRDLWPESAIDTGVVTNPVIIKLAFWFERFIYKKAKKINVLTPAFRETLIQKKQIAPEKIIFIPNAADFSLSDQLLESFDAAAFRKERGLIDKWVITYVGAHGVANHLAQLIPVAEALKDYPVVFQLIGDGMEKKKLVEKVQPVGLKNIAFIDSVPKSEVFKYILASDMGTSVLKKVDTFKTIYSNKTFDYMACKKPVLMLIDGVSRALVEEADCGVYAEPENTAAIVDAIKMILDHKELFKEKGEKGYLYAKQYFDRSTLANQYLDALNDII